MVDLDGYFRRIGHAGGAAPTLGLLREIHARHVEAIPFENLGAFLGEPPRLDLESLQAKLLTPGRGGWCFEHNILLSQVLLQLGFEVRRLSARVRWNVAADVVTPRSHMLMRVTVDGEHYIADAGFGGLTLSAPLRLEPGIEQPTCHEPHRLLAQGDGYALQARVAGEWSTLYLFDLTESELVDYEAANWYLGTNPKSQFLTGIIAALAPEGRRHALRNTRYSVHHVDGRTERRWLGSPDEIRATLRDSFHVDLPRGAEVDDRLRRMIAANPGA